MKDIGGKMVEMTGPQRGEEWVNDRIARMQTGQMDDLLERSALDHFQKRQSREDSRVQFKAGPMSRIEVGMPSSIYFVLDCISSGCPAIA
jgi:hypothetical protein